MSCFNLNPIPKEKVMAMIPAKVTDRFRDNLSKLQKVIEQAKSKDINESDTVVIVSDILTSIFGYDKYNEVTHEYAIKNTYCDLAVKIDGVLKFLIEVKAIGITLADKHCQQALNYGANNGTTDWIVLTNGLIWRIYKVKFEKPINADLVCEFNFLDIKLKNPSDIDKLFILCKEGLKRNAIDEFAQHRMVVNKYYISSILQSEPVVDVIKKEIKKINPLIKVENDEIVALIVNEILKRDLLDSPEAIEASDRYCKIVKKLEKKKTKAKEAEKNSDIEESTGASNVIPEAVIQ